MFMNNWFYWTRQTLLLFFLLNLKSITAQVLPTDVLQNGYAVVSCFADTGTDAALAIVDMRQAGTMHDNTANHGAIDLSSYPQ